MAASSNAIRAGRAFVELFADDSKLVRGLKRAQAKLKAFGTSVRAMGTKMLGIGSMMAAPMAGAAKAFADFETQMKMVSTMLNEPEKHMASFSRGVRDLSVEFGEGTDVLAKGLYDLLSASVDPARALDVLRVAVKSAKGGMTDTAVAVDGLTSVLNAFQMDAGKAGHVADVMFQTVKRGKLTFPELAANIGKVAPMARAAGMSMEDMMASIATMTRQGLNAEEATTRLVNILKQAPEEAGNIADLAARYVGKSLSEIQLEFPEVRAAGGIAALSADIAGFKADLALMQDATGQADEAFGKMTGGLASAAKKAKMAVVDLAVSVGEALAPTLKAVGEKIVRIVKIARDWLAQNQGLVLSIFKIALGVVAAGVGLIILGGAIGVVAKVFGVLTTVAGVVHTALSVVMTVITAMLTPIGLVITAVLAFGAYMLYASGAAGQAMTWLGEQFTTLANEAKETFGAIGKALASGDISLAAKVLWSFLKLEWEKGCALLEKAWLNFRNFFIRIGYDAFYGLLAVGEYVWHGLEVAWIEMTSFLSQTWTKFTSAVMKAWAWCGNALTKAWNKIKGLFDESFDSEAANAAADQAYQAGIARIEQEKNAKLTEREQQRSSQREQAKAIHDATLAQIGEESLAKEESLDKEYQDRLAASKAAVDAAQREWQNAISETKSLSSGGNKGPGPLDPNKFLEEAKTAVDGVKGLFDEMGGKAAARGTFNAAAIQGLQTSDGAAERTAKATEETAKNTKTLAAKANTGGLVFE